MRIFTSLTRGCLLAVLTASAATGQTPSQPARPEPLKPGRSAGVKAAQAGMPNIGLALVGASAVIAVVVVTTSGGKGGTSQPNSQSVVGTAP
jgi:hypothetical protein